jgi:hypothetical protein
MHLYPAYSFMRQRCAAKTRRDEVELDIGNAVGDLAKRHFRPSDMGVKGETEYEHSLHDR